MITRRTLLAAARGPCVHRGRRSRFAYARRPRRGPGRAEDAGPQPRAERREAGRRLDRHAQRRRARQDQGHERQGRDRHALWRQRLVAGPDPGAEGAVRGDGHRGHRGHRRRLQAGEAGLRHRDGDGAEAQHHRLDPGRPGRRPPAPTRRRPTGREARVHGQRPEGLRRRQGLCQRRLGRQLRQRRRVGPPDGQGAGRQGRDRPRLPRRRLLRHQAALRRLQEDDRRGLSRHQDRRPSRASAAPTSPATPRRRPRRC